MATRDEHLKKINAELEQLSDDDLEKIAGGTTSEMADDSRFLNVLLAGTKYHQCDRYGGGKVFFDIDGSVKQDIHDAWQSLGISTNLDNFCSNDYYMNGQKISRYTAWKHAQDLVGRQLTKKDWDW